MHDSTETVTWNSELQSTPKENFSSDGHGSWAPDTNEVVEQVITYSLSGFHHSPSSQVRRGTCFRKQKISQEFFCTKFFCTPSGHGRPRVRVMDVRPQIFVFPRFRGPARGFWPGTSARMTPGRPRDVRPENFLFALFFRS